MRRNRAARSALALVIGWCGIRIIAIFGVTEQGQIAAPGVVEGFPDESDALSKFVVVVRPAFPNKPVVERPEWAGASYGPHHHSNALAAGLSAIAPSGDIPDDESTGLQKSEQKIIPPQHSVEAVQIQPNFSRPLPSLKSKVVISGSSWILYRANATSAPLAGLGQLGGSQAGLQVVMPVMQVPKLGAIAAQVRLSRALQKPGQGEAGVGLRLTIHPKIPINLAIERRIRLDEGGRNAFAAGVATGFDDTPLRAGLLVSAYGQAGVVGFEAKDLYADGAIKAERRLFKSVNSEVRIGIAVWGAAQPGVSRVDFGPRIGGSYRIGGMRLQASAEWRQRLAGNARPNSGPVLTIGTDF